jgi:hypothetical protein
MKKIVVDAESGAEGIGQSMVQIVEDVLGASLAGMADNGNKNISQHLYVCVATAAAALQLAAKIMTMPPTDEDVEQWNDGPVDRVAVLAASLLVSRCFIPGTDSFTIDYSPENILAAIDATEKITGKNNDAVYTPSMVKVARQYAAPAGFFDNSKKAEQFNRHTTH